MEIKEEIKYKPIDIKQIFMEKNPRMAKLIPGFAYAYLRRILHLDYFNEFLRNHGNKMGLDFINAAIAEFNVTMEITGKENIPFTGRYIFVSNHPLGGFDGMLLMSIIGERFPALKSISNDILMNLKNLADLFVPVNKHGSQSVEVVKNLEEVFNSDCQIMTFPAGLVSRRRRGVIKDPPWKKNFITKAIKHQRDIIPINMNGRCTGFFYNLANLRKFFGIKANIEMFYLPDETYRHRNKHVKVIIGKPIHWKTFDKRFTPIQWALKMQDYVYSLPESNNRNFEEFLKAEVRNETRRDGIKNRSMNGVERIEIN